VAWEASGRLADLQPASGQLDWTLIQESGCRRIRLFTGGAVGPDLAETVALLADAGLAVHVTFIVGRPGEPEGLAGEAYKAARALLRLRRIVTVELRLFEPWPGGEELEAVPTGGHAAEPKDLLAWSGFKPESVSSAWTSSSIRRSVLRWSFYLGRASARPGRRLGQRLVHRLARARVRMGFYGLDLERRAVLSIQRLKAALTLRGPMPAED
jgi:hypothetical protein